MLICQLCCASGHSFSFSPGLYFEWGRRIQGIGFLDRLLERCGLLFISVSMVGFWFLVGWFCVFVCVCVCVGVLVFVCFGWALAAWLSGLALAASPFSLASSGVRATASFGGSLAWLVSPFGPGAVLF